MIAAGEYAAREITSATQHRKWETRADGESLHNPGCVCLFRNYGRVKCIKKMYWIASHPWADFPRVNVTRNIDRALVCPGDRGRGGTTKVSQAPASAFHVCVRMCARVYTCTCKNLVSQRETNWGRGRLIKIKPKLIPPSSSSSAAASPAAVNTRFSYYRRCVEGETRSSTLATSTLLIAT